MRIFLLCFLALTLTAGSCSTDGDCGPFGPIVEREVRDTLTIQVPQGIDSIYVSGAYQRPPTFELIRNAPGDSIRFEAVITTATVNKDTVRTKLHGELQPEYKRLYLSATYRQRVIVGKSGARVECTPMGDQMDIKHVKIFMPEGVNIKIARSS
jgi:hypothetical protein